MAEYRLRVISESTEARHSAHVSESAGAAAGHLDVYLCGKCGIILERVPAGTPLETSLLRWPNCGVLNGSQT